MSKESYNCFIGTISNTNTRKVVKSFEALGEVDYSSATLVDIEQAIIVLNPNSIKSITTICHVLGLYLKHTDNDGAYQILKTIDRKSLWLRIKHIASKKFLSNDEYLNVIKDIDELEQYNALYIKTLFNAVYEGIYNDDLSVIKNLRSSDVNGNIVLLREDNGNTYSLEISKELSYNLKKLGDINTWRRLNRFGECQIKMSGAYTDSCFKTENRGGGNKYRGRYSYYRILRGISKNYLGFNLLPLHLYTSGLMHHISIELNKHDISVKDAFSNNNKDRTVSKIISDELARCNCDTAVKNFRELVFGHTDSF